MSLLSTIIFVFLSIKILLDAMFLFEIMQGSGLFA